MRTNTDVSCILYSDCLVDRLIGFSNSTQRRQTYENVHSIKAMGPVKFPSGPDPACGP